MLFFVTLIGPVKSNRRKTYDFISLIQANSSRYITNEDVFYMLDSAQLASAIEFLMQLTSSEIEADFEIHVSDVFSLNTRKDITG